VIIIEPILPIPPVVPTYLGDPMNNFALYPAFFETEEDSYNFLSSLDSDTRDYVINHTDDFRTKSDIIDCVYKLRNGSQD
jgi:hypothetical protein